MNNNFNINVYSYQEIDNIVPKNKVLIWCTCAEFDQKNYFKRVQVWYKQLKTLNIQADFFVFNDGLIKQDIYKKQFQKLNFVYFPKALGRQTIWFFPGFKRSFYYALKLSKKYTNFIHLQSDAYINKRNIFYDNYLKSNICAYCQNQNYNFMQTVFMIINNKDVIDKLIQRYSTLTNLYQDVNFEIEMSKIIPCNILLGKSWRRQSPNDHQQQYQIISQCSPQYILGKLNNREKNEL